MILVHSISQLSALDFQILKNSNGNRVKADEMGRFKPGNSAGKLAGPEQINGPKSEWTGTGKANTLGLGKAKFCGAEA